MKEIMEKAFKDMVKGLIDNNEPFALVLPVTDDWEHPLPVEYRGKEGFFVIAMDGWTMEESHADESGVYIKTAFDDMENRKFFNYQQMKGILSITLQPIFYKPYDIPVESNTFTKPLTLKDIMHDEEGQKRSMAALRKHNPKE